MSLELPALYGITAVSLFPNMAAFLARLDAALAAGLQLLQVRDKQLEPATRIQLATECVARARAYNCQVLINDDAELATQVGAAGVHLSSAQLATAQRDKLPGVVGVSCHDKHQLATGLNQLQADFAVLSPVLQTLSHVDAQPLGWEGFATLTQAHTKPIYALGGLADNHLAVAQQHGAIGLASMRAVWGLPVRLIQQQEAVG